MFPTARPRRCQLLVMVSSLIELTLIAHGRFSGHLSARHPSIICMELAQNPDVRQFTCGFRLELGCSSSPWRYRRWVIPQLRLIHFFRGLFQPNENSVKASVIQVHLQLPGTGAEGFGAQVEDVFSAVKSKLISNVGVAAWRGVCERDSAKETASALYAKRGRGRVTSNTESTNPGILIPDSRPSMNCLDCSAYSCLRATMGSIRAARRAGT